MRAKLIINNEEIEIIISEEELKKIKPETKRTGYERVEYGKDYYTSSKNGNVNTFPEFSHETDNYAYEGADYYSDKTIAENNSRADKLMRQLRRFAVEHRKEDINYSDGIYEISYDCNNSKIKAEDVIDYKYAGSIPFNSRETTELAIETFKDELLWYFTEYKDSL